MALPSSNSTQRGRPKLVYAWTAYFIIRGIFVLAVLGWIFNFIATNPPVDIIGVGIIVGVVSILLIVFAAIYFGLAFITYKAKHWARWLIIGFTVFSIINSAWNLSESREVARFMPLGDVLMASSIIFLVFDPLLIYSLFRPEMKTYFRKARVA